MRTQGGRGAGVSTPVWALAGLTAVGFALRLLMAGQSLVFDERYTYVIATETSLGRVLGTISATESTPPLFYFLSWIGAQLGDAETMVRWPSVVLGALTIPIVYLLAARWRGRDAGLLAALMFALAPAALFFGSEARAFATAGFFVALATLSLLLALERSNGRGQSRWRWALFVVSLVAAIYSHYIVVFPLAALLSWALWSFRARWRAILLAYGAAALAYLPWLPSVRSTKGLEAIGLEYPFSLEVVVSQTARTFPGFPPLGLDDVPGALALTALLAAACIVLAAAWLRRRAMVEAFREGRKTRLAANSGTSEISLLVLFVLLSVAPPLGVAAYSVLESSIYIPRNLIVSLPFFLVLVAAAATSVKRPVGTVAAALIVVATVLAAVRALDPDHQRPQLAAAAELVEARAPEGGRVLQWSPLTNPVLFHPAFERWLHGLPENRLPSELGIYLPERYAIDYDVRGSDAWSEQDRVLVVSPGVEISTELREIAGRRGFELTGRDRLPGEIPLDVWTFNSDG